MREQTYQRVALEFPDDQWELVCGRLRKKPVMAAEHNQVARELLLQLVDQIDRRRFILAENSARLRVSPRSYVVPDLCVIPRAYLDRLRAQAGTFEVYEEPVPLVVEVWSPSTGDYDVDEKLDEYRRRGDLEIWRSHPYERTLIAWYRQAGGSYAEQMYADGTIRPVALPAAVIEIDRLFE